MASEHFIHSLRAIRQKPGMILEQPSIKHLYTFIVGYQSGSFGKDDTMILDSFDFWVYHRYRYPGAMSWKELILEHAGGDEAAALRLFFEHLEEYLSERERIGPEAIKERFMTMLGQLKDEESDEDMGL